MKTITILLILVVLFLAGCEKPIKITNFEECAAAGNPVMESYPKQCRADGELFVEEIETACEDNCGDGVCAEVVCMAIGCPCAETPESCPKDCKK